MTLIEKLEAATEGSRELDAEIALTQGWTKNKIWWITPHGEQVNYDPPCWSTSLDAALLLIPEGMASVKLTISQNKPPERQYCHATLEQDADSLGRDMENWEPYEFEGANAATAPLALCIAALRARETQP